MTVTVKYVWICLSIGRQISSVLQQLIGIFFCMTHVGQHLCARLLWSFLLAVDKNYRRKYERQWQSFLISKQAVHSPFIFPAVGCCCFPPCLQSPCMLNILLLFLSLMNEESSPLCLQISWSKTVSTLQFWLSSNNDSRYWSRSWWQLHMLCEACYWQQYWWGCSLHWRHKELYGSTGQAYVWHLSVFLEIMWDMVMTVQLSTLLDDSFRLEMSLRNMWLVWRSYEWLQQDLLHHLAM